MFHFFHEEMSKLGSGQVEVLFKLEIWEVVILITRYLFSEDRESQGSN